MQTRTILPAALCLALGAGAEPTEAGAAPGRQCPKPTLAICAGTPTDSACGQVNLSACKELLHGAWKQNPPPTEVRKMLRVGGDQMPADLRDGRFYRSQPTRGDGTFKQVLKAGLGVLGPAMPVQTTGPQQPKPGHRNKTWEQNGSKVASCAEYAYEWIYDWGRFVDSAALCGDDLRCFRELALMPANPGVARRTLVRRDGAAMAVQPKLLAGASPKNILYTLDPSWVYAGGEQQLAPTPELQQMAADLKKGSSHRAIGCATPTCKAAVVKYASEWDFHAAMHQKLADVGVEEFEELARRRAEFQRLFNNWARAAAAEESKTTGKFDGKLVKRLPALRRDPGDRMPWEQLLDPWERLAAVDQFDVRFHELLPALGDLRQVAPAQLPGGLYDVVAPAAGWGLGFVAPSPSQSTPSSPKEPQAPPVLTPMCAGRKGSALGRTDVHACLLAEFVRHEWRRKSKGQRSCLDLGDDTCDWSPEMFRERVLAMGEPALNVQQRVQDECLALTRGAAFGEHELADVAGWLAKTGAKIAQANAALASYALGNVQGKPWRRFGTSKGDSASEGNPAWFAGGYQYQFGWSVAPKETDAHGLACKFEAETNNSLSVHAHVLNGKISVFDAGMVGKGNQDGAGKLRLDAHLRVLGEQLYGPSSFDVVQAFHDAEDLWAGETPRASATFWAGVPLTLSGWGQVAASYQLHGEAAFPAGCAPNDPRFSLVAAFTPTVDVNARAQVGVGIGGVASIGVRGTLNLLRIGFPLTARLETVVEKIGNIPTAQLRFNADLALTLATLAGRLALYIEFLFYEDEWEIFRWAGIGPHRIEMMKLLDVELPLVAMTAG